MKALLIVEISQNGGKMSGVREMTTGARVTGVRPGPGPATA